MPLYEYKCTKCDKTHEMIQKFSDAPLEKCPDCDGLVTKLLGLCSFSLKGSGWYATDYKRPATSKAGSTPAEPAKDSSATPAVAPAPAGPSTESSASG